MFQPYEVYFYVYNIISIPFSHVICIRWIYYVFRHWYVTFRPLTAIFIDNWIFLNPQRYLCRSARPISLLDSTTQYILIVFLLIFFDIRKLKLGICIRTRGRPRLSLLLLKDVIELAVLRTACIATFKWLKTRLTIVPLGVALDCLFLKSVYSASFRTDYSEHLKSPVGLFNLNL
jgi:hypothetical protein